MKIASLFLAIGLMWSYQGEGNDYEQVKHHVHEAFMTPEASVTLLTAIPQQPPAPLQETRPQQTDPQSIWVPGYWEWSFERSEFIWCSGGWRRPPSDHQWIPGRWINLENGWVRTKGFWSKTPESSLSYIQKSPPDPYDESPKNPPAKDYFWMAGYWKYQNNKYVWFSGKWEKIDPNWIYVPARYVWRQEGYVFVPAFWDWPMDQRGVAYACVAIPSDQTSISYSNNMILEPMTIVQDCLLYYPDYYYFYFYYYFFHVDWWWGCAWCPPWWGWDFWWWMPWFDHWGLWWWWLHPGFPAPFWLNAALLDLIFGPPLALMHAIEGIHPPVIIGPDGLIPPANLLDETEDDKPIFPLDPTEIQEEAGKDVEQGTTDRPQAPQTPHDELDENAPPPPQTTPRPPTGATPGEQPSIPSKPPTVETPSKPEVPPSRPPQTFQPRPSTPPTYQPRPSTPPPTYQPRPSTPPSYRPSRPPSYRPQQPPQYQPPTYQPPRQPPSYQPPSYRPSRPPSQYYPPSQTRPRPSYPRPSQPNVTPPSQQQYVPQTPQLKSRPPSRSPSQQLY